MARYRLSQHDNKHTLSTCTIDVNQCACSMRPQSRQPQREWSSHYCCQCRSRALTLGVGPGTCTRTEVI